MFKKFLLWFVVPLVFLLLPQFSSASVIEAQYISSDQTSSSMNGGNNVQTLGNGISGTVKYIKGYFSNLSPTTVGNVYSSIACFTDSAYSVPCSVADSGVTNTVSLAVNLPKTQITMTLPTGFVMTSNRYYKLYFIPGAGAVPRTYGCAVSCYPGDDLDNADLSDMYFILEDDGTSVYVSYPYDGLYGAVNFPSWGLYIPSNVASTTLKAFVRYSTTLAGTDFSDSLFINYSSNNSQYSVGRNQLVDLSLGTPSIPKTWYAFANIYADYNNDGDYNNLVATSGSISFVYYPGSVIFNSQLGTSTGSSYIQVYSSTSTCPTGLVCTGPNGSTFYIDSNGNVVNTVPTTTVDQSYYGKFYALWQGLQYKVPWGYITLLGNQIYNIASTSATSTSLWATSSLQSFGAGTSTISVLLTPLRTFISYVLYAGTIFALFKGVIKLL